MWAAGCARSTATCGIRAAGSPCIAEVHRERTEGLGARRVSGAAGTSDRRRRRRTRSAAWQTNGSRVLARNPSARSFRGDSRTARRARKDPERADAPRHRVAADQQTEPQT